MNKSFNAASVTSLALALVLVFTVSDAFAGTGGTAFDDVWLTLTDWTQGTLGRIIAGSMVVVGLVSGIARQSLMAFGLGIGGGMGLYNTPDVIETIMTATLPVAVNVATEAGMALAALPH
ncbi:TraA family conjugative transfer protein [Azospirillum sp. SYSU D00513]|uniref:TraA family conjugative transfer protein n=1 Tax=Azospirillum sp. SYSU D00513 TaxID=2812561 RepID=UPI001FFF7D9B|nr:TraA family conjugative transfer protein [Azospirillum sp. SYSU D00513]